MMWLGMALPFVLTILLLRWMLHSKFVKFAIDQPNHRSLHTIPVPRTGGLAIMVATLFSWGLSGSSWSAPLAICALLLMALSLMDDIRGLSAGWRFTGHFVVTAVFIWLALYSVPIWVILILTMAIVWMTNLFNFMDGADGLAGGMAMFGFGAYTIAAWLASNDQLLLICMAVVASAAAFLLYNFHPARIFMGDAGSIPLGFLSAGIGLLGWQSGVWPAWFPLLVFSPFIVDATVTLIKRLLRGEKIWQAHRSHYYQRLVQVGWGHRKTAVREYGLMLLVGTSAVWLVGQPIWVQWVGLVIWLIIYALLMFMVDRLWEKACLQV